MWLFLSSAEPGRNHAMQDSKSSITADEIFKLKSKVFSWKPGTRSKTHAERAVLQYFINIVYNNQCYFPFFFSIFYSAMPSTYGNANKC